jgi:site-specific DNA recombinase
MKTAAIYARVSTAGQARDGTSLDSQVDAGRAYALKHGYIIAKEVREDISGARLDRPGLDALRDLVARGELQAFIVYDPDRLSRSMGHLMLLSDELERHRCQLIFINAPREDTPEGRVLFGMRGLFAEYERAKIMERTRRGKERTVRNGKVIGNRTCAYGYRYVPGQGRNEVVESEAIWVRRMYEWLVDERCTMREIARRLTAAGVPTKTGLNHWNPGTLRNIMTNRAYIGEWYYNRRASVEPKRPHKDVRKSVKSSKERRPREEWIMAPVPAIVDRTLFDLAQRQLSHNKAFADRNVKYRYLLKGLLICGYCGRRMYGHTKLRDNKRLYECAGRRLVEKYLTPDKRCPMHARPGDYLESLVWREVLRQVSDPELIIATLEGRDDARMEERRRDEAELSALFDIEQSLKRDADKLLDLHMADVIDIPTLQERMVLIKQKQEALAGGRAEIIERMTKRDQASGSVEAVRDLCERVLQGLPRFTLEDEQEFLRALDIRATLTDDTLVITGLISEAVLSVGDRRQSAVEADPNNQLNCDVSLSRVMFSPEMAST